MQKWIFAAASIGLGALLSCSGTGGNDGSNGSGGSAATGTGGSPGGSGGIDVGGTSGTTQIDAGISGSSGAPPANCNAGPDEDQDQDGWTRTQGDCNDCDKAVNPGAIDMLNASSTWGDEDCDGTPGSSGQSVCDSGLPLDYLDPMNAAKAIELCKTTTAGEKTWGVLEAKWVRADGAPYTPVYNIGIQPGFGPNVHVQAGNSMLALSSGNARTPGQPNACNFMTCNTSGPGTPPPGFPQDSPNCDQAPNINDDVALQLRLRAPTNATGYRFKFRFYTFEFPEFLCSSYNDQFIALVDPPPPGANNGNISFDSQNNPVSVNVAFFTVCLNCLAGTAELVGTGFDVWGLGGIGDAGGTVWLQTQAPVTGGQELTIRFAIWDTGDTQLDSTVLIDGFEWLATSGVVDVGTTPIPVPQ